MKHLQSILTQDNQCTRDPFWLVFGHKKIFVDPQYAEEEESVYLESETGEQLEMSHELYGDLEEKWYDAMADKKMERPFDPILDRHFHPDDWERHAYIWVQEYNQAFFTEAAAKEYIEENSHRIPGVSDGKDASIYVDSLYRNKEMIDVRQMLIDKAQVECHNVP